MTQSLLNNLNRMAQTAVNYSDNSGKSESNEKIETNNFARILDKQTEKENPKLNNNNSSDKENDNNKSPMAENDSENLTESDIADNSTSEMHDSFKDTTIDTLINLTVIKDICINTDTIENEDNISNSEINQEQINEQEQDNIGEYIIAEETNVTDENSATEESNITEETNENEESNITEEDPTMLNELNTLNDPTAILLLQSQTSNDRVSVLKNNEITNKTEESTSISQTDANNKNNSNNLNSDSTNFKQFDSLKQSSGTVISMTAKDKTQSNSENAKGKTSALNENMLKELNIKVVSETQSEQKTADYMQNQTPQEQAARVLIQGDIKISRSEFDTSIKNVQVKPTEITSEKIIEQISKQLDGMHNNSKLSLVLNPGSLGKVNVQILNTKDGLMALFTVATNDARDLIMKGLDGLKESLLAQGVNIDNVSVKLEEPAEENQTDLTEQEGSNGGNMQQGARKQKEEEKPFEQMMYEQEKDDTLLERE